jgi:hypothetical protein
MLSTAVARPLQLITRVMQWSSAVIVMGITSYFIHLGPRGQHLIYQEVISTLSVAFFLPAFISPFMPTALSKFVLGIDVIFSYLYASPLLSHNPMQANRIEAGSRPSSSPRKTITSRTATSTRPRSSTAARKRPTRLSSSWHCMFLTPSLSCFEFCGIEN